MSSVGSVTQSLASLRKGSDAAAAELFKHFLPILRRRFIGAAKSLRIHDEDDIATSAFYELCVAIEKSRFADIADRTELWQVLSMIAIRKANDFRKNESALRRGSRHQTLSLSTISEQVAIVDERPDLQLEMFEQCERVVQQLPKKILRQVAGLKIKGYSNAEIGRELGLTNRSIQLMVVKIKEAIAESYPE